MLRPRSCLVSALVLLGAVPSACSSPSPAERTASSTQALTGTWVSYGMPPTKQLAAGLGPDSRLVAFGLATAGGSMPIDAQALANGVWNAPSSLGGNSLQQFAVGHNADGRLEVFAIGGDGALYHVWQVGTSGAWGSWVGLGGRLLRQVAVANESDGRLRAFVLGGDGNVYTIAQTAPNGGWGSYAFVGGAPLEQIAASMDVTGEVDVVGLSTSGATMVSQESGPNGSTWGAFQNLAGWASQIAVAQNADGRIEIYQLGTGGVVYHQWRTPGGAWSGWSSLTASGTDIAVGHEADGSLDVFVVGLDGGIYEITQNGPNGGWGDVWPQRGTGPFSHVAVAGNADGRLELFGLTTSGDLQHTWQDAPNGPWEGVPQGPPPLSFNVSAALFNLVLGNDLNGLKIQIGQDGSDPEQIYSNACRVDYTAQRACEKPCIEDGPGPDPGDTVASCLKGCQGLQRIVCDPPTCESQLFSTFIDMPTGLQGATQACNPLDCQTCTNGTEPALFNRPLDIPYPIATFTKGLITYHCTMNHLVFTPSADYPVVILPTGVQILLDGTTVSPAISCDNGAPDLDLISPNVAFHVVPSVKDGKIVATVTADFASIVKAHDPLAQGIADIADAQDLVTSHGTAAINAQAAKLGGPIGQALDTLVRNQLPQGATIIGITFDFAAGITVTYTTP